MTNANQHHDHHDNHEPPSYADPVCGMSTGDENAFTPYEHEGKVYYFCSDNCMSKFKADPGSFTHDHSHSAAGKGDEVPVDKTGAAYTCPMHPEILQDKPGSCPKCGMALEALNVTDDEEDTQEYDYMRKRFIFGVHSYGTIGDYCHA